MGKCFVQIGAGAGDQDSRANFRDGFTEYVKKINPSEIERIVLIEPNPANIPLLRKCWQAYPQAEIVQVGIRLANSSQRRQTFYYAEEDAPHFQVFSIVEAHVRKHYPKGTIKSIQVDTITIPELFNNLLGNKHIDLLALDIEGIDAEIILEIDWKTANCFQLSFEHLHLGLNTEKVLRTLGMAGYMFIGNGLDVGGFDLMYEKISG